MSMVRTTLPATVLTVLALTLCLIPLPYSIYCAESFSVLRLTPFSVLSPCNGLFLTVCTISGGCGLDGIPMSTGVRLSQDGSQWHGLPPMQNARGGFGLVVCGNVLIAVGGSGTHTAVHKSQVHQVSHDLLLTTSLCCLHSHSHTHTHSLSPVLVVTMKSKKLKT